MTEEQWLCCDEPWQMPNFCAQMGRPASERKLRLFACACAYRIWDRLPDERCRNAVRVGERLADGDVTEHELSEARQAVQAVLQEAHPAICSPEEHAIAAARYTLAASGLICFASSNRAASCLGERKAAEEAEHAAIFRDIVGNPFRNVKLGTPWLSEAVASLARVIYAQRTFERLPELADYLTEAGCANNDVLSHCRKSGQHVRGCWVVDWLLTKV